MAAAAVRPCRLFDSVVVVVLAAAAAAAAVAVFVVDESFLGEVVGVLETAVVVSVVMLIELYRPNHVHPSTASFLLTCNSGAAR